MLSILVVRQLNLLKSRSGITVLQWSVIIFLLGETFCGIDIYLFRQMTLFNELVHETAMMFSFSGFVWSAMILSNTDRNCLGIACPQRNLCQIKPEDCSQARIMAGLLKVGLLGLIILSVMPFFAVPFSTTDTLAAGIGNKIFGSYRIVDYSFLWSFRLYLAPGITLAVFCVILIRLFINGGLIKLDRMLLSLGLGFLIFIINRLFLLYVFRENGAWGNFFEEIQELMFILILLIWSRKTMVSTTINS